MSNRTPHLSTLGAAMLGLALAAGTGCASTGSSSYQGAGYQGGYGSNTCQNCGTVTRITVGGASGKAGAVIGGIIGAVAGHEISAQTGGSTGNQNLSTVAGAAAGAAAGNAIQKNRSDGYTVHIRMDDGRTTAVTQGDVSGFREGSRVRISDGRAYLQ
jgi:outer membrane lipoprotein SlyB